MSSPWIRVLLTLPWKALMSQLKYSRYPKSGRLAKTSRESEAPATELTQTLEDILAVASCIIKIRGHKRSSSLTQQEDLLCSRWSLPADSVLETQYPISHMITSNCCGIFLGVYHRQQIGKMSKHYTSLLCRKTE